MALIGEQTKRLAANSLFPSFFHAAFGVVLAQVGAAQLHGSWSLRVFLGAPGLVLAGLALFRARLHWPAAGSGMPPLRARALGGYVLLLAAGASMGILVVQGAPPLLGVAAALAYVLPWSKVAPCRARFVMAAVAMLAGAAAWVVLRGRPDQALYFMMAAGLLYFPAMGMHLLVLAVLERGYRA